MTSKIQPKLRPHREAIAALEADGLNPEPVRFGRGDHLIVAVSRGDKRAQVTISGSPKGGFIRCVIGDARRKLAGHYGHGGG